MTIQDAIRELGFRDGVVYHHDHDSASGERLWWIDGYGYTRETPVADLRVYLYERLGIED
jgi:hypothetical protein